LLPLIIGAGIAGVGVASNWWASQEKAAVARDQAALMRKQADEDLRRSTFEQEQVRGNAVAQFGASGVEFSSRSIQGYLEDMTDEFAQENEWAKQAWYASAAAVERGADQTAMAGNIQAGTDFTKVLFDFGRQNNWWKSGAK
jgi:hypothetical protein